MSQGSAESQHEEECALANSENCAVCKVVFSKRRLTFRHHCGICARSVCSACSPSNVQVEGHTAMQRACTPCVSNAVKVPGVQSRLVRLGEQLDALGSKSTGPSCAAAECTNLEEALDFSESAVAPLEDLQDRLAAEKAHTEKLERALAAEKRVRAQLEQEIFEGANSFSTRAPWSDSSMLSKLSPTIPEKQRDDEVARSSIGKQQPRGLMCFNWFAGK